MAATMITVTIEASCLDIFFYCCLFPKHSLSTYEKRLTIGVGCLMLLPSAVKMTTEHILSPTHDYVVMLSDAVVGAGVATFLLMFKVLYHT